MAYQVDATSNLVANITAFTISELMAKGTLLEAPATDWVNLYEPAVPDAES
jgi:hypothetical protein